MAPGLPPTMPLPRATQTKFRFASHTETPGDWSANAGTPCIRTRSDTSAASVPLPFPQTMFSAVYANHAGTSWPKPEPVREAVRRALEADPLAWADDFERDHARVARAFHVDDPSRLLLTPGCTSALAVAIADLPWQPGDRVVCGSFEHHALMRPLLKLAERGVELVRVPPAGEAPLDLDALEHALRLPTRLVATTAAGNVTGALAPLAEFVRLAHGAGALALVDAAQVAGWLDLDVRALDVDLLAFAGHKGPQAPWGVGGLYVHPRVEMQTPHAVCDLTAPCAPMPGYCDTGSVDRAALAGLAAGFDWLAERPDRLARARSQVARLERAALDGGARRLGPAIADRVPTLALVHERISPSTLAAGLRARGVIASSGLQCAPEAHRTLGTDPDGVLRLSVGPATTDEEVDLAREALRDVLRRE